MFLLDARLWSDSVHEVTLAVCPSVRPSFRPSARPSLSFLKIGSLVLSDIVHDDILPLYLVTDEARFLRKKIIFFCDPNLGPGPKWDFSSFSWVWIRIISFPWNWIQWQLATMTNIDKRLNPTKKNFWAQICARRAKIGPKIRFFAILSSLVH